VAAGAHHLKIIWPISLYYLMAFSGTFFCYYTAARVLGGAWRQRIARFPLFLALSIGMSVHNARAALEGLFGKRSPFERTPKYRVTSYGTSRGSGRYRSRASWSVIGELILSAFSFAATGLAIQLRQYGALPFLLLFAFGYGMVGVYSLRHMRFASRKLTLIDGPSTSIAGSTMGSPGLSLPHQPAPRWVSPHGARVAEPSAPVHGSTTADGALARQMAVGDR
jgi:hypothetical protein